MLDLRITLNNGFSFPSEGWRDRPIHQLIPLIHQMFSDVRDIEIVRFTPC